MENIEQQIEKLKKQQDVIKARLNQKEKRLKEVQRKKRTKRLIEDGAILESFLAVARYGLEKVPEAPRVSKKDDPEGYEAYRKYREFVQKKEELMQNNSTESNAQWLADHYSGFRL